MPTQLLSSFPVTQRDVSRLRQTATDAVNDLGHIAATHTSTAKGQWNDLTHHVQEESIEELGQLKGRLGSLVNSARNYASKRPLACIGTALVVGFFMGLSRRSVS